MAVAQATTPGWVYVLASTSHPGVVKVGRTGRNALGRARELDRSEGYATFGPWQEVWSRAVSDSGHVETAAHRMLAHRRLRIGRSTFRELFRVDAGEACRVVEAAAGSLRRPPSPRRVTRFAVPHVWRSRRRARFMVVLVVCLVLAWMLEPGLVRALLDEAVRLP